MHFDVLVVGAGSAGSVIASRLSEDPACAVGLIEAGDWPSDPDIADPLKWTQLPGRAYDWAFRTEPQPHTAGRVHDWPRGRVIGGSSCINAMAHVRGHPKDFDAWAAAAGADWSYEALLPGFVRSESLRPLGRPGEGRGRDGPFDVFLPDSDVSPVARAFMAAGTALGAPRLGDHNCGRMTGTAPNSLNIRDGRRLSVGAAYLSPGVLDRPNLTVLTRAEADRLEIEGSRIGAVEALVDGQERTLTADRVVLCAGAVSTPLLLMRSGIGDPQVLKQAGIGCHIESPETGRNLQDHLLVLGNVYEALRPVPPSRLQHSESLMYLDSSDIGAADARPDIVVACVVAPSAAPDLRAPAYGDAFTLLFGVTSPTSRGQILPRDSARTSQPVIDPHYLETDHDRATFRKAFRLARRIGHHPELADWNAREVLPGSDVETDADVDAFIAMAACTHHHPCGTCRMGQDAGAVVDPELKVNGLDNLFVVDASVIPEITSGPINAAVIAVAETWAARKGGKPLA